MRGGKSLSDAYRKTFLLLYSLSLTPRTICPAFLKSWNSSFQLHYVVAVGTDPEKEHTYSDALASQSREQHLDHPAPVINDMQWSLYRFSTTQGRTPITVALGKRGPPLRRVIVIGWGPYLNKS